MWIGVKTQPQVILARMPKTLSILGAGRVGRGLGRRLRELGWKIGVVSTRSEARARKASKFIGAGRAQVGVTVQVLAGKNILVSVPDDAVAKIADELARIGGEELRGKFVVHTSGALDSTVLSSVRACGASVASMHPLQTFSGVGVPPLEGRVFAIEGDEPAVRMARRMARGLGGIPVNITAAKKPLYHAAGAFAARDLLALEEAAVQTLMSAGMNRKEAPLALLSLSRQVLENYEKLGPQHAWTGPLSRGDYGVVAAHEEALHAYRPELLEAYQAVSRLAALVLSPDAESLLKELETVSGNLRRSRETRGDRE
jgi:predicted short-subunit dehydrogenase-like oxidoreductase (DUF2520 family)